MLAFSLDDLDFADAWLEGDDAALALGVRPQSLDRRRVLRQVRNAGDDVLRFAAIYAEPDIVTTYREPVQPDGTRERHTVS